MSQTMSSPSEWMQFYQHNPPNSAAQPTIFTTTADHHRVSDATAVTTTASTTVSATSSSMPSPRGQSSMTQHLIPDGRVSKPIRRRSRASRRTPTTLLNTDTTNFRAMVQQFTGGPTAPFASGSHYHSGGGGGGGGTNFNFGLGTSTSRQQIVNPAAVMLPTGYHLQFQQQQQPHQQQQYHQQHQQYMFSLNNNNNNTSNHGGDAFLQRLSSNPRPNMEVSAADGFVGEAFSSQAPPRASSSNENRSDNNFMF